MIEKGKDSLCSICGRPNTGGTASSITQWISVCRCAAIDASAQEHRSDDTPTCSECSKRINTSKAGSITQWIFSENFCKCKQPKKLSAGERGWDANRDNGVRDLLRSTVTEVYMEVDPVAFPIERYKPIRLIGRGALGEVYLCRDVHLKKQVAVKCLLNLTADRAISFQNEAKIVSKLNHETIISVLDFGTTNSGRPFMVMEYFPGKSLQEIISEHGQMDESYLLELFSLVCDSLTFLHDGDVLHRDLKPSNILVGMNSDGSIDVRLIDFGLSKTTGDAQTKTIVGRNTIVGTPGYMCPDLVKGGKYDVRSEIYSLGCVMFEALVGSPPFKGETALEILNNHVNKPVPLISTLRPEVSDELCGLIGKCLNKDPSKRFASLPDVANELKKCKREPRSVKDSEPDREGPKVHPEQLVKPEKAGGIRLLIVVSVIVLISVFPLLAWYLLEARSDKIETTTKTRLMRYQNGLDLSSPYMMGNQMTLRLALEDNITEKLRRAIEEQPRINRFVIDECEITKTDAAIMASSSPSEVKLTDCKIAVGALKELAAVEPLEQVRIFRADKITPDMINELANAPNLHMLELNYCELTDEHFKPLRKIKKLDSLHIYNNDKVTLSGIKVLCNRESKISVYTDGDDFKSLPPRDLENLASNGVYLKYLKPRERVFSGDQYDFKND